VRLETLGKVLGQPNPAAEVDGKLAKLRDDDLAAIRAWQKISARAERATCATFRRPRQRRRALRLGVQVTPTRAANRGPASTRGKIGPARRFHL